jgi:glycosyltransferase involved in cell wall biosynthesis
MSRSPEPLVQQGVVMQLVANLDRGGAQEVVRTLARHLPAQGWKPVVATFRDGPLRNELEEEGVTVVVLPARRHTVLSPFRAGAEFLAIRRRLAAECDAHGVTVVQTHLLQSLDFVTLTLRRHNRVVLWTVHNALLELRRDQLPEGQRWLLAAKRAAYRLGYSAAARVVDGFVAVSDDVASEVCRAFSPPRGRLLVIANGVDTGRFSDRSSRDIVRAGLGVAPDGLVLIVVAKLYRQKGHSVLLEALASAELPTNAQILLVGDGPERARLESEAGRLGLGRVLFLGNRPDIPQLLAASDLFVLPSLWEGLPIALLEAMAAGLPVVATDVAGSRQVITDGQDGMLVKPGDPEPLRWAILSLISDAAKRTRLGQAAKRRVETEFSASAQAAHHARAYTAALKRRRAGGAADAGRTH